MAALKTSVLTPDGPLFEGNVHSINVPGSNGDFQVLPGHAALMSTLEVGIARVKTADNKTVTFSISGGFAEVKNNEVIVLAESAEQADQIDVERALASKKRAEERLYDSTMDRTRAEASLKRAVNRLKLAGAL